ncbi:unnamed protein product, partial [Ectocarpus sp. 13 AM-2016]
AVLLYYPAGRRHDDRKCSRSSVTSPGMHTSKQCIYVLLYTTAVNRKIFWMLPTSCYGGSLDYSATMIERDDNTQHDRSCCELEQPCVFLKAAPLGCSFPVGQIV